jgi:hypothetical protein
MEPVGDLLKGFDWEKDKYISREFQKYGYDLAQELNDLAHKALYMKLAKETPRQLLEQAKNFVKDAGKVRSKARLFMWRLQQLRRERKKKGASDTQEERRL